MQVTPLEPCLFSFLKLTSPPPNNNRYWYEHDGDEEEEPDSVKKNVLGSFDVNIVNASGNTLLITAAQVNSRAICKLLIKNGVSLNHQNARGETCLHAAFKGGWDDLGYYLADKIGVDDKLVNEEGYDCYKVASSGEVEMKRPDMYLGDGALGSEVKVEYGLGGDGSFGMDYDE